MSRVRPYAALLAALVVGVPLTAGATAAVPDPPKIDSHPRNPTDSNSASFTFSHDKKVAFRCQLDSGDFSDCGSDANSGSVAYSALVEGTHTFNVKAVNEDGEAPHLVPVDDRHAAPGPVDQSDTREPNRFPGRAVRVHRC